MNISDNYLNYLDRRNGSYLLYLMGSGPVSEDMPDFNRGWLFGLIDEYMNMFQATRQIDRESKVYFELPKCFRN